jgi:hypothetical protein
MIPNMCSKPCFLPWFLGDAYYMLIWTGDGIIHHGCCHWVYHTIATKKQHRKVHPSEIVMIYGSIYLGVAFYPIASCWGGLHRTLLHWGPSQPQKESHGAACPGQQEFRRINGYVYISYIYNIQYKYNYIYITLYILNIYIYKHYMCYI